MNSLTDPFKTLEPFKLLSFTGPNYNEGCNTNNEKEISKRDTKKTSSKTLKTENSLLNIENSNLWRLWSNGYDVRLWKVSSGETKCLTDNSSELANSVRRGFDSPLSPLNCKEDTLQNTLFNEVNS